ncbi:transcription initiation factor TFIIF subunit beta [Encephalitozoon intestinalis ATCC 50506]|uniref:Transcription initiation factor IIF subunit beta n=1 Tax=Encephalitozoon intestinalis (strain ATCC 50506) TaxID=876142 RepID=E0S5T7_ENCIT|nr:transcription initiation factor TFIIF subunit beta [Encephalitozoon intestinalis ATCC 50506]ADM11072.1 transcription initiation factor TFIIF subunit beta [Encephalitozoon intestinalis ATCC 50506]UTX44723.1 transcription initiation factor TFIIF subunit beta [Encephalitozoon intestinalis]
MELNTNNKNTKIWLAKVPLFLAERILSLGGETTIGELDITKATSTEPAVLSLKLSKEFCEGGFPSSFEVKVKPRDNSMYVIRAYENNADVEGVINNECYITPEINGEYLRYKKEAGFKSDAKKSDVQVIDYLKEGKRGEKFGSLRELEYLARKRKKMLMDKKRERLGKNEVIDMVFKAFEKYPSWTVKDLADFCGQPVAFIQEIVSDICVLNKKDLKNAYELRPEYR